MSASSMAQYGPAINRPKSITRMPANGPEFGIKTNLITDEHG
jgi:hypothetical protein